MQGGGGGGGGTRLLLRSITFKSYAIQEHTKCMRMYTTTIEYIHAYYSVYDYNTAHIIHVLMRCEKEGRKKQARSNKQ